MRKYNMGDTVLAGFKTDKDTVTVYSPYSYNTRWVQYKDGEWGKAWLAIPDDEAKDWEANNQAFPYDEEWEIYDDGDLYDSGKGKASWVTPVRPQPVNLKAAADNRRKYGSND